MSTSPVSATIADTQVRPTPGDGDDGECLDAADEPAPTDAADETAPPEPPTDTVTEPDSNGTEPGTRARRFSIARVIGYGVLPAISLLLAMGAGALKWQDSTARDADTARIESMQAARDSTVAMLSYRPDTADKDLVAARERMTGAFRDSYTSLTNDVVIPGATQKHISAVATVPAAASVSANPNHAVALVFINQTVTVGTDPPTASASTVRVTLDKVGGRWLISHFDPI